MPTQCLASTGSNLLAVLGIGFVLAIIGFFLLRSAKGRAAVMVLVLVGGGLLVSQATSKPASAACVASSATTMPAPTTTTAPSSTTTTTTAPAAGFTFKLNLTTPAQGTFSDTGCSGFTANYKVAGPGPGTPLVNANSSFPTTLFQSVPVPVTASTTYVVIYSWSCTGNPSGLFAWGGSATSNIPPPVTIGPINISPAQPTYTWSSTASFTTGPDVSAPTGIQITYQNVPV